MIGGVGIVLRDENPDVRKVGFGELRKDDLSPRAIVALRSGGSFSSLTLDACQSLVIERLVASTVELFKSDADVVTKLG